ncbi:MAG TPA: NAD(P)-dependent oxidoreductase [Ignavibacteriaceae bacterium]|nr:NAD(P)-dependent oxidoreductase [Ignavibacteriaceae bacterium]
MKILITGGSGLLGQYLNIELAKNNSILTIFNKNIRNCKDYNSIKLDINDRVKLEEVFGSINPRIVIHTAAISNPQIASHIDPKLVYSTNVIATRNIAELCARFNARLIYISTDLVYAGYRGSMLKEDAKLIPVSFYAESKLMGEVKIKEIFDNYLILRISLLYGFGLYNSHNHFHQMFLNLKSGIPVKLFGDQFRTPIELNDAARIIDELAGKEIKSETINVGGKERLSRFQLGELLCKKAGFDYSLLHKITMDEIRDFPKVEDVSLDTSKLQSYGIIQNSVEDSINKFLLFNNYENNTAL